MDGKYFNDDELISAINRSSLPYIIVEGKDDEMIYRWILEDLDCESLLEPRNGCGSVKRLFSRKDEITNPKVIFICDKDTIVYTGTIPENYSEMIYTEGYSIENDLYKGKALEPQLFKKQDRIIFSKVLDSFLRAYACELEKFRKSLEFDFNKINPECILDKNDYSLKTDSLSEFKEPAKETIDYLKNDYDLLVRGHFLFSLVRIVLGRKDREIKYSIKQLYELCYSNKSDCIVKMQNRINQLVNNMSLRGDEPESLD